MSNALPNFAFAKFGTPDRIRTCDPLLRRQMLYPTELRAHLGNIYKHKYGADGGI